MAAWILLSLPYGNNCTSIRSSSKHMYKHVQSSCTSYTTRKSLCMYYDYSFVHHLINNKQMKDFLFGCAVSVFFLLVAIVQVLRKKWAQDAIRETLAKPYKEAAESAILDAMRYKHEIQEGVIRWQAQTITTVLQSTRGGSLPPLPSYLQAPETPQLQQTDGRTDGQPVELVAPAELLHGGTFSMSVEKIKYTDANGNEYNAPMPYEDDDNLQPFSGGLGYYAGLCQYQNCGNRYITKQTTAKFCSDKCRKANHSNTNNKYKL